MRQKLKIEGELVQISSDLVEERLKSEWGSGQVDYLLGLAVGLSMVLNPRLNATSARQMIVERIDRSVTNIKARELYQLGQG